MGILTGYPVTPDIDDLFFGFGIDLCLSLSLSTQFQVRFSSDIFHTPRDIAFGHILLRNYFICRYVYAILIWVRNSL